jgi:hypothetical protein
VYLWIFLRMKNVSDKSCRKNQNILYWVTFLWKLCRFWHNVENFCKPRQATDGNTIRRRKDDICMPNEEGNNTSTLNICYFLFHCNNGHGNASHCYVTRTLHVLFISRMYVVQYRIFEQAYDCAYPWLVYYVVCFLLGNSPASEFYIPTFRNTLSAPSS